MQTHGHLQKQYLTEFYIPVLLSYDIPPEITDSLLTRSIFFYELLYRIWFTFPKIPLFLRINIQTAVRRQGYRFKSQDRSKEVYEYSLCNLCGITPVLIGVSYLI